MKALKTVLSSSEWSFLLLFFTIIASLIFIAKVNTWRAAETIDQLAKTQIEFLITIEGAVKNPGEYRVKQGTSVEAALRKARLSPYADLSSIPLKEKIQSPLHLKVGELQEIQVSVEGEVLEPLQLTMAKGSRICDLKSKITFTSETDKRFFRRRKLLRDGDKIVVPKKGLEQN